MVPRSPLYRALCEALDEEYRARATYRAVIGAFGPVFPFAQIIHSEQRHVDMLRGLLIARGLPVPDDSHVSGTPVPATVEAACRMAILAETENALLYDQWMTAAEADAEVAWVFRSLRRASARCHLKAFQRRLAGQESPHCGGCDTDEENTA